MKALAKAKSVFETELAATKKRASQALAKRSAKAVHFTSLAAGGAGGLISAAACAIVDDKVGQTDGDLAYFGKSPVPICGPVGLVVAMGGAYISQKHPGFGAFFYQGGMTAANTSVYVLTRKKLAEADENDD